MIANQVVSNLSKNLNVFSKMQTKMSTGREINKPSDNPSGTVKDLSYRSRLAEVEQFSRNVFEGQNWLTSVDSALDEFTSLLTQAKEIAVSMANDTYDDITRDGLANEVEDIIQQMLSSANLKREGRYIFAGHMTRTEAFTASSKGVVYNGDQGEIRYEIESGSFVSVNITGSDILTKPFVTLGEESDFEAGIEGSTLLSELNNGRGLDLSHSFVITDQNLNNSVTITIPPATTDVNGLLSEINSQLAAGGIDNVTAQLSEEGNNIKLVAVDKPDISLTTPLSNINYGNGLGQLSEAFVIHNADDSINVTVDLSAAATIGDVITEINTALSSAGVSNVTAALNAAGTGIDIEDTNIVPLGLTVSEDGTGSTAAADLGLLGNIAPTLNGADLNPAPDFAITESAPGQTLAQDIGILGNLKYNLVGEDLDPIITLNTPVSLLNNGLGNEMGQILISQGDISRVVDLGDSAIMTVGDMIDAINNSGLFIQASINEDGKGIQIESTVVGMSLLVENNDETKTASTLGIAGSPDLMGNLLYLVEALRDNDQRTISSVIGGIEEGIDHILNQRAAVGAKLLRFENTSSRLQDYNLELTKMLSETEDADIVKLTTDLAVQENIYTAALNSAAQILQPTLLDFLR